MHLHTLYSDGTVAVDALLQHIEAQTDLDLVAITDHERLDGALRAREMHAAGDFHFDLVVGEEITTRRGHVLALFIEERIPALRPLPETLERIHDQGGLAIAAHPLAPLTPSLGRRSLLAPPPRPRSAASPGRDRAAQPQRRRSRAPPRAQSPERTLPAPGGGRQFRRPRARARRHRLDLVPRRERRGLPAGHRRAGHRACRASTGAAGTTSRSTAGSSSPRAATCAILSVPQESGDDAGPGRPGAPSRRSIGPANPCSRSAEGRHRQPIRLPASGRGERARAAHVRSHAPAGP